MPFCPQCGAEFPEQDRFCSFCGVSLVDREPLVPVADAPNEPIAMLWSGILGNEKIHCLVKATNDLRSAMYVLPVVSHYQIWVLASQSEIARNILTPFTNDDERGNAD